MHDYTLIRSARRTLAIEIDREANLIVRAPNRMPRYEIEAFLCKHAPWIAEKRAVAASKRDAFSTLSDAEIAALREKARDVLPALTAQYAARMGLTYRSVKITNAKSRFGSCGKNGNICYALRLMLYPAETWDYVVVHELCHLKHFDHSRAFYAMLEGVLPDYRVRRNRLKDAP